MSMGRRALGFGICFGIFASMNIGCAAIAPSEDVQTSPVRAAEILLPVSAWGDDLILQQTVTIRWQDREESFEAVLQKLGDQLLLLGLGPMSSVGFTLTLDELGVRFENRSGREMPFEAERILADVQRVFYPWIETEKRCTDCEQRVVVAGLKVSQRVGPEHLEERRFEDSSGTRSGEIVVHYQGWMDDGSVPARAVLSNGWYGYELTVVTRSVERPE